MKHQNWSLRLIALSFFVVLVNPLGWHMFLHVAPFYISGILKNIHRMRLSRSILTRNYFFFVLFTLLSAVAVSFYAGAEGRILRYCYELIILMFFVSYPFSLSSVQYLFKAYALSCFIVCLKMLVQRAHLITDENRFTILNFGKLMDPNFLAALFVFPTLMLINNIIVGTYNKKTISLLLLFLVAIVATGSRGALFAIGIGSVIIYMRQNVSFSKKCLLFLGVVLLGAIFLYVEADRMERFSAANLDDDSNELRFNLWSAAWDIFKSSPLLGCGANSMLALGLKHGARINLMVHNTYLEILADYGLVGFLLWSSIPIYILKKALIKENVLVQGALIGTVFCAFFISAQNSAFYWQNILFCYLMLKLKVTNIPIFKLKK